MKRVIAAFVAIILIACAQVNNRDKALVHDYLAGQNEGSEINVTRAENLGLVYSPLEFLNSQRMSKAMLMADYSQKGNDAFNLPTKKERTAALDAAIAGMKELYEDNPLDEVMAAIQDPRNSVDDEHPANREAIYAEYKIDGKAGSGFFYLERNGDKIGHTDITLLQGCMDLQDTFARLSSLIDTFEGSRALL